MYQCNQKVIQNKVGLLNLAEELGNISKACKVMGYSRDTFYRYKEAVEVGGVENLLDKNRRKPNLKNRTDEETEKAVIAMAIEFPAFGPSVTERAIRGHISVKIFLLNNMWALILGHFDSFMFSNCFN